jgi:hypothetical protein
VSDCLIDFDAFPKCPEPYYDENWDDSPWFDFEKVYEAAQKRRAHALEIVMRQRVLSEEEEIEAIKLGEDLSQNLRDLSEAWLQQRRLQMISKGVRV